MITPPVSCPSCETPLPQGASFCPVCGEAAPTHARTLGESDQIQNPGERQHAERLQEALGEGYRVKQVIGRGGFGLVYAATDVAIEREVAVKVLRHDLFPTPALLERFRREARTIGKLSHPNIIPVYAVGEGEGLFYVIMPRIAGEPLAALLRRHGRLAPAQARRILIATADALHAAHEAGVVHRDVKPDNILLEGKGQRVLLTDFGIAKRVEGGDVGITSKGTVVGTPLYMSPEQATGAGEVDARSDVYSLGVVAYQLLSGRLPFEGTTPQEILARQVSAPAPPLDGLVPQVPTDLASAVMRCLAIAPAERWGSADELARALRMGSAPGERERMEEEAATADTAPLPRPQVPYLVLGAVGLATFALLFARGFPQQVIAPRMSRNDAVAMARQFFSEMGAVGSYDQHVTFTILDHTHSFLQQSLGIRGATQFVNAELPLGRWKVRWVEPQTGERWTVGLSRGVITEYEHVSPVARTWVPMARAEATALAHGFLRVRGWRPDSLVMVETSGDSAAGTVAHRFAWDKAGTTVTWRSGTGEVLSAPLRVWLTVTGSRVTRYEMGLDVPPRFWQALGGTEEVESKVARYLVWGFGLLAVIIALGHLRGGHVSWSDGRPVGVIIAILLLVDIPAQWESTQFDLVEQGSQTLRAAFWVLSQSFTALFTAGLLTIFSAAGVSLARTRFPRQIVAFQHALRRRFRDPSIAGSLVPGYLIGAVLLGCEAVFFTIVRGVPGAWIVAEPDFTADVGSGIPFFGGLALSAAEAIIAAVFLVFTLTALLRYVKLTGVAAALLAVFAGLLYVRVEPLYIGIWESALIAGLLVAAFIRFGLLACLIGEFVFREAMMSAQFLGSGMTDLRLPGILAGAVVLILPLLAVLAWSRSRDQHADRPLTAA